MFFVKLVCFVDKINEVLSILKLLYWKSHFMIGQVCHFEGLGLSINIMNNFFLSAGLRISHFYPYRSISDSSLLNKINRIKQNHKIKYRVTLFDLFYIKFRALFYSDNLDDNYNIFIHLFL
jgi:hypothetical protein